MGAQVELQRSLRSSLNQELPPCAGWRDVGRRNTDLDDLVTLQRRFEEGPNCRVALAEGLLRIRDRNGELKHLKANAAQKAFEAKSGRHNIVLKARQMGITTWVAGHFFLRTILYPGTTTLLVAHTREASEAIFAIVRRMWDGLPEDLREDALRLQTCNAGQMVFEVTGSEFRVSSASDPNAGRGISVQNLHCSEVSRWPGDAEATLAGLRAALAPDGEMVLESTPSGAYGAFYREWCAGVDADPAIDEVKASAQGGLPGGVPLVRHFLPWWLEPAYVGPAVAREQMTVEEGRLVERHGLSPTQIGFRRGLERSYGVLRSQEFAEDAESCFRATGMCCFEVEVIERRLREVSEPVVRRRNGAWLEWFSPLPGRRYVLGVDTAGGGQDGDYAVIQVLDRDTGIQCAEVQERLRPRELAELCVELARMYGDAVIAVERNNHGAAVLALLEDREGVRLFGQGGLAGWLTSASSKPEMVARLGTLLQETPERFFSKRFLAECRTFVADEQGRMGGSGSAHDDLVMGMAIAQAVRAELLSGVAATRA